MNVTTSVRCVILDVMSALFPLITALALASTPALSASVAAPSVYFVTVKPMVGQQQSHAMLACKPKAGTHPYREQACAQLLPVAGRIEAIPPADGLCTMEYAPVKVRAAGVWKGIPYKYEEVFSNRCEANLQTGGFVFNLST